MPFMHDCIFSSNVTWVMLKDRRRFYDQPASDEEIRVRRRRRQRSLLRYIVHVICERG